MGDKKSRATFLSMSEGIMLGKDNNQHVNKQYIMTKSRSVYICPIFVLLVYFVLFCDLA